MKLRNLAFWAGVASMAALSGHADDLKEISFLAGGSSLNVSYPNNTLPLTLGYWEEEGLDVTVIPGHGTLEGAQQIVGGGIQFAEGNAAGVIQAIDKNNLPIKATITYEVNGWSFVVPEEADVSGPEWFEDKRLGVYSLASGSIPLFKAYMGANDLDSVELIPLGYGAPVIKAMNDGQVDAVLYWATGVAAFENVGLQGKRVAPPQWRTWPDYLLFTHDKILKNEPDVVVGMARGMAKALLFAQTNPECARQLHWKHYPDTIPNADDQATAMSWDDNVLATKIDVVSAAETLYKDGLWGAVKDEHWASLQDFMISAGQIDKVMAPEGFVMQDDALFAQIQDFDRDAVIKSAMECNF